MSSSRAAAPIAVLLYATAVIAGGASAENYDHLKDPISALMAGYGGPFWLYLLFGLYNGLLLLFALGLKPGSRAGR
ncbi:MAG: hypothetical protein ACYC0C_17630 [Devosia sp.]